MKKSRKKISNEKIDKIYHLHGKGFCNSQIANIAEVSIATIGTYLKIKNLEPHHKLTKEGTLEEIKEYLKKGKGIREIAFLHNVSYSTMVLFLKKNGLK